MPDSVACTVCGETNPIDAEFCRKCLSRLRPAAGTPLGEHTSIQPGVQSAKEVAQEGKTSPALQAFDLLAGLVSQGQQDEEGTPDWVTAITGKPAKQKQSYPVESQVKSVELDRIDEPATAPSAEKGFAPSGAISTEGLSSGQEVSDWFKQSSSTLDEASADKIASDQPSQAHNESVPAFNSADLDWLKRLEAEPTTSAPNAAPSNPGLGGALPDWMQKLDDAMKEDSADAAGESSASVPSFQVRFLNDQNLAAEANLPAWLKDMGAESNATTDSLSASLDQGVPDRLGATALSLAHAVAEPLVNVPEQGNVPRELPDFVRSPKPVESTTPPPSSTEPPGAFVPAAKPSEAAAEASLPAAFADHAMTGTDVEAIFAALKAPDWLSEATQKEPQSRANLKNGASTAEDPQNSVAELSTRFQRMRQVESSLPNLPGPASPAYREQSGALADLPDLLPAASGSAGPSVNPNSYSSRADLTE